MLPKFETIQYPNGNLNIREDLSKTPLAKLLCKGWKQIISYPNYISVRESSNAVVGKLSIPGKEKDLPIYIKHFYKRKNWKETFKELVRQPRVIRAYQGALLLLDNDIPTAKVIAAFDSENDNYLITEEIVGAQTLYQVLESIPKEPSENIMERKKEILMSLAKLLAEMHSKGIYHHDLRAGNILANPDTGEIYIIDTDRVTFETPYKQNLIIKNIAQLNMIILPQLTTSDRVRFFNTYIENTDFDEASKRGLFNKVESRAKNKLIIRLPKERQRAARSMTYTELVKELYKYFYSETS